MKISFNGVYGRTPPKRLDRLLFFCVYLVGMRIGRKVYFIPLGDWGVPIQRILYFSQFNALLNGHFHLHTLSQTSIICWKCYIIVAFLFDTACHMAFNVQQQHFLTVILNSKVFLPLFISSVLNCLSVVNDTLHPMVFEVNLKLIN